MKNIAIIGTGGIAAQHIMSYKNFPDRCRIVALCDIDPARTAARAAEFDLPEARLYQDYHEMLMDSDLHVDIVSIAAPPFVHCEAAVAALESGCHVLTEKPMAPSVEECDRMIEAAERNGKILSSVAQNRFDESYSGLKSVVDSGKAGRPLYILVESVWWRGSEYYDMWWRGTWEYEVGGATLNVGVHQVDLLLWIMGMPAEVNAMAANLAHDNSEVEDVSLTLMRFPSGAVGEFNCTNFHHGEERQALVQCEKAGVWAPWKVRANLAGEGGFPRPDRETEKALDAFVAALPDRNHKNLFYCQIENYLDALDGKAALRSDAVDGRNTIEMISAIYKSAFTGEKVTLPLLPDDPFYSREGVMTSALRFNEKR